MVKLQGNGIYLATLERKDCRKIFEDFEYDFANPIEHFEIGFSNERSDEWFDEIQKLQGKENIRLGIFLDSGEVIGDVALQGLDAKNRSCSVGIGIAKLGHRGKGYGKEAVRLIVDYGFGFLGMERIWATTTELNIPSQKTLEACGFVPEGKDRKAEYFCGKQVDVLRYGMLLKEHNQRMVW